jgi:importin subunit beta-1
MAEPSLVTILENTVSPDKATLENALHYLENAANINFLGFCEQLSQLLCTPGASDIARRAAGLQLKNQLTSKDQTAKAAQLARWIASDLECRNRIKQNILNTLGTETYRPSTAAQCIAAIAAAELPDGLWPGLLDYLCQRITEPASSEMLKESAIEAIGYICQDIDSTELQTKSNELLTAIINGGMRREETSDHVKLAATTALLNSLEFTRQNFERDQERHFIMQVVCEATQSTNHKIKVASLQCLVKIMSLYYQHMEAYMGPALFAITLDAMKTSNDDVALQGIEFWSSVCDEEMDLLIEASEAAEQGAPPTHVSHHYAKGALNYVVPILLETLTKQDEDEDEWNPCKAASVCLMLLSNCCENDIVQHVLPFVEANLQSPSWNCREAALMAFGSIMEGPEVTALKPLVTQVFNPHLINMLRDTAPAVQDTAAWAIGRICEILPDLAVDKAHIDYLVTELLHALDREPRVASNVCWAFTSLASAAYDYADVDISEEPNTFILSKYFENIVQRLLATTDRQDGGQCNLRTSAYEAIMELVKNSPQDCYLYIQQTTIAVMERLHRIIYLEESNLSSSDRQQYIDLQGLLCATLQSVIRKIKEEDAVQIADKVMESLLKMLQTTAGQSSGVQEDAYMAMGTLVEKVKKGFLKYMPHFFSFLLVGLRNSEEHQVCQAAVGLIGDLSRALGPELVPYCDQIMGILLEHLSNNNVDKSMKPPIICVFGDIALAIGPSFVTYLEIVLNTLNQASLLQVNKEDYDMVDYVNELREACLEGYTGIVQGLRGDAPSASTSKEPINNDLQAMQNHVPPMMCFISLVAQDEDRNDNLVAAACGLVGDLIGAYGSNIGTLFDKEKVIKDLLQEGRKSKQQKTKTLAVWATKELKNACKAT